MEQGKIFITVPQFAQAVGISQQAVYKQVKSGRLKQYAKKTGRQTKIDAAALVEIYEIDESKIDSIYQSTSDNKGKPESTSGSTELQLTLAVLREQLVAKDRQIDDLSQRLREAHKLLNDSNEALRMLTGPQVKKPEVYEEPVQGSEHADQSAEAEVMDAKQAVRRAEEERGAADRERQRLEAEKNAADQERQRLAEELAAEKQRREAELQAAREQAARDAAEAAEAARQAERSKSWFRRLFNV
jgi:hypothetical protein